MNFRGFICCRKIFNLTLLAILFIFYLFPPLPQQANAAIGGTWYFTDENVGSWNTGHSMYCLSSDDCKISYYNQSRSALKFFDCNNTTCSSGTTTILDGMTGCTITNCDTSGNVGEHSSIFCPTTDDCKITYRDVGNSALVFIDCDNASCSTGTRTVLDGDTGCTLSGCSTSIAVGSNSSIYCISSSDCKISYPRDGLHMADCSNSACSSGTTTLVDNNSGCALTGCDTTATGVGETTIYCLATDDCKMAYYSSGVGYLNAKFADCSNAVCSTGQVRTIDGDVGCTLTGCSTSANVGGESSIFCVTTSDCKIAYSANGNSTVQFADCNDATCSSGTTTLLDGDVGCMLTGCQTTVEHGDPSVFCVASDDCKVTYQDWDNYGIRFADCDNSACTTGTTSPLDGLTGCPIASCRESNVTEFRTTVFCLSSTDCKVAYHEIANTDQWFVDCDNSTCTSGQFMTIDGHFLNQTEGDAYNSDGYFGEYVSNKITRYTMVSEDTFPSGSDTVLGSGTYTFRYQYSNNIGLGNTLDWQYEVGYCLVSDNCTTRTPVVTSASQQITSSLYSPIDIDAVAASNLTIPGPDNSKRIYIDLEITGLTGFANIYPVVNSNAADFADTFISIPIGGSAPTPTPTPVTGLSSASSGSGASPGDCTKSSPSKAPILYQINSTATNATLYFVPAGSPVSRHRISYGINFDADQHNITTSSSSTGAMEFTIQELLPNTTYYFKIRGENDCQPGEWSNIVSSVATSSQVPSTNIDEKVIKEIDKVLPDLKILNVEVVRRDGKVIISWNTNIPSTSSLRFGLTENEYKTITSSILGTNHRFEFDDLYPPESIIAIQTQSARGNDVAQVSTQANPIPSPTTPSILDASNPLANLNNSVLNTTTAIIQGLHLTNPLSYQDNTFITFTSNITFGLILFNLFYLAPLALRNLLVFFVGMIKDAPIIIVKISSLIPHLLRRKKKQYHWGTVFDSLTKQPIDPAIISLRSQSLGFIPKTAITNFEGHFGFLVDAGKYLLSAKKSDYVFPSKILAGKLKDGERENLYFGDEIEIKDPALIHADIPMDPVRFNWNQANKPIKYHPLRILLKNQTLLLFSWIGLGLSLLTYILHSTPTNLLFLLLYIVILFSSAFTTRHKKWGTVFDKKTRTVQPLTTVQVVRILDDKELEGPRCLTDHLGRYFFIVGPGTHFIQVYKEENGVRTVLKKTDRFTIKRGDKIYNKDIQI